MCEMWNCQELLKVSHVVWQKKNLWGVLRFCGKCLSLVPETVVRIVVSVSNTEVIKTPISVLSCCSHHICHISGPYFDNNLLHI